MHYNTRIHPSARGRRNGNYPFFSKSIAAVENVQASVKTQILMAVKSSRRKSIEIRAVTRKCFCPPPNLQLQTPHRLVAFPQLDGEKIRPLYLSSEGKYLKLFSYSNPTVTTTRDASSGWRRRWAEPAPVNNSNEAKSTQSCFRYAEGENFGEKTTYYTYRPNRKFSHHHSGEFNFHKNEMADYHCSLFQRRRL